MDILESNNSGKSPPLIVSRMEKKSMKERNFPPLPSIFKSNVKEPFPKEDDEILIDNFDYGSKNDSDVICNVVSVLLIEYNTITEVIGEENEVVEESTNHKSLCYYVMNNGCVDEDSAVLERPYSEMQQYLKPFLIWAKVENAGVNKVLVDGRATINLMPHSFLRRLENMTLT